MRVPAAAPRSRDERYLGAAGQRLAIKAARCRQSETSAYRLFMTQPLSSSSLESCRLASERTERMSLLHGTPPSDLDVALPSCFRVSQAHNASSSSTSFHIAADLRSCFRTCRAHDASSSRTSFHIAV